MTGDRGFEVGPFGQAEAVGPLRVGRGAGIVAVGDQKDGPARLVQERQCAVAVFARAADAVDKDRATDFGPGGGDRQASAGPSGVSSVTVWNGRDSAVIGLPR